MRAFWITTLIGSVLCLALGSTAISSHRAAVELRHKNETLQSDLQAARTRADSLTTEKQETAQQLASVITRHGELTSRIRELEAAETEDMAQSTSPANLRPYQAEAYIGRKSIGLVWIVPRNLRLETNSQRYVYEPVVCLDEKLRKFFEVHHTNIVERTLETPVYVNNSYYEEPYYYAVGHWPRQTNSWPSQPAPAPYPTPPPFNPGSGTIIRQPIGTPAEKIKTYPSAPRLQVTPANPAPKSPTSPTPGLPRTNPSLRAAT